MPGKASLLTTVSISVLAFCLSGAVAAERTPSLMHLRGTVHRVISAVPGAVTLYDQNSGDSGFGVPSENFQDGGFDSYDAYGADDFTVPAGHTWKIRQVEIAGIYGQSSNPAESENVLVYKDQKGFPGAIEAECNGIKGIDNQGSFAIKLPKSCKVRLKGGKRYWISIVANEDSQECCTLWFWETRNSENGKPAAWENPGNGYGTGCKTWDVMTSCIGDYGEGPDFMFTLKGKDIAQ